MTRVQWWVGVTMVFAFVCLSSHAAADPITFGTRTSFVAAFGRTLVDGYSHSGYRAGDIRNGTDLDIHSDERMSSVVGETRYTTTGWSDLNIIYAQGEDAKYCGGCNGSFLLTFRNTSVGEPGGVLGVAFDFTNSVPETLYGARVLFGNGSVRQYALPYASTGFARDSPGFWGIAAPELITSIHFGPSLGAAISTSGSFSIDNLTLGGAPLDPVPEPTTLLLVGTGIGLAARARASRRSRRS